MAAKVNPSRGVVGGGEKLEGRKVEGMKYVHPYVYTLHYHGERIYTMKIVKKSNVKGT